MSYTLTALYQVAGVSKQAYFQYTQRKERFDQQLYEVLVQVDALRAAHPGCGLDKMYWTLKPEWLGRDRFIEIFKSLGYYIKRPKSYRRTTFSVHSKYENLITGMRLDGPDQLWESDITYFEVEGKFYYLTFIIDAYTKILKGYYASDSLRAEANIEALKMAFRNSDKDLRGLIHHSDRGGQYVDKRYIKLLEDRGIQISMGLIAQHNAYAERINGTIKNEFLTSWDIQTFSQLKRKLKKAVDYYNHKRIHCHLPHRLMPITFLKWLDLNDQDRPTVTVYAEGRINFDGASSPTKVRPRKRPLVHDCPIGNS
jgi:transposase InsO family protein